MLRRLFNGVNELFWPGVCAGCRCGISESDRILCQSCWSSVLSVSGGDYCPRCGVDVSRYALVGGGCPRCQGEEIFFDGIARGGIYSDVLRRLILSFKHDKIELEKALSFLANSALSGSGFYDEIEIFVPVPLHWMRRLLRGYNQSLILARGLNHSQAGVNTDLVRIRHTKVQSATASAFQRVRNVAGAFAVRRGHVFEGRNICLVDDIKTSGATLNECSKTLKEAGASKVFAVVVGVAGQDSQQLR